jgi:hypothetical protein
MAAEPALAPRGPGGEPGTSVTLRDLRSDGGSVEVADRAMSGQVQPDATAAATVGILVFGEATSPWLQAA